MFEKIKKAGLQILTRNVIGIMLSMISVYLILKYVSAVEYAAVAAPQLIFFYAVNIGMLGQDVLILKSGKEGPGEQVGLMYQIAVVGSLLTISIASLVLIYYLGISNVIVYLFAGSYLIKVLSTILNACKESKLDVSLQMKMEVIGQVVYIISLVILLVTFEKGVFGIAAGVFISNLIVYIGIKKGSVIKYHCDWRWHGAVTLIKTGAQIQYNSWIWQFREAMIPVILKANGQDELLGSYGLANQVIQKLGFLRQIVWRLAIPALSGMDRGDKRDSVIARASELNTLGMAVIYMGLGLLLPYLAATYGRDWSMVSVAYLSLVVHLLLNTVFTLYCAAFISDLKLKELMVFHSSFVMLNVLGLYYGSAYFGSFQIVAAELLSGLAYVYLYVRIRKNYTSVSMGVALLYFISAMLSISLGVIGWYRASVAVFVMFVLIDPNVRSSIKLLSKRCQ
ncbi:MAG: hypothetical protein V5B35_13750 [Candidatus Accumulibacter necessarius]|jgi:O-antigen/teichoic acid export membrane protein|uniref:hypothetical protein n=1 Tax=Candidatus Accumulibacter necessarius TaxID=2954386 RepID=UPI002FC3429F